MIAVRIISESNVINNLWICLNWEMFAGFTKSLCKTDLHFKIDFKLPNFSDVQISLLTVRKTKTNCFISSIDYCIVEVSAYLLHPKSAEQNTGDTF